MRLPLAAEELQSWLQSLTDRVGHQLLQDFGTVSASEKDDGSLITRCDRWADDTLQTAIRQKFPDHGLLTEEGSQTFPNQDWVWVIDPIDGTTNFARGIPLWGISIALLYRGEPVFGMVRIPPLNQCFVGWIWGDAPGIATLNGKPLRPSPDALTPNHLFSFCTRSIQALQHPSLVNVHFPCKIRMLGVATYNLLCVGTGAVLGALEATPKVWDIAAVWVILKAAGVIWEHLGDRPFPLQPGQDYLTRSYPCLLAASPSLASLFRQWSLTIFTPERD
jgi:myo-inositol-1(or 4)-monophosphatase